MGTLAALGARNWWDYEKVICEFDGGVEFVEEEKVYMRSQVLDIFHWFQEVFSYGVRSRTGDRFPAKTETPKPILFMVLKGPVGRYVAQYRVEDGELRFIVASSDDSEWLFDLSEDAQEEVRYEFHRFLKSSAYCDPGHWGLMDELDETDEEYKTLRSLAEEMGVEEEYKVSTPNECRVEPFYRMMNMIRSVRQVKRGGVLLLDSPDHFQSAKCMANFSKYAQGRCSDIIISKPRDYVGFDSSFYAQFYDVADRPTDYDLRWRF